MRLSELAELLLVNRTNMTRLTDRLEASGLIQRKVCKDDRRGAYAVLTQAGLEMQEKMWTVYAQSIAHYFSRHLTEKDTIAFTKAFSDMLAALDKEL